VGAAASPVREDVPMNEEEFLGLPYEDFSSSGPLDSAPPVQDMAPVQDVVMTSVVPINSEYLRFFSH
jgi:hypothetical protein